MTTAFCCMLSPAPVRRQPCEPLMKRLLIPAALAALAACSQPASDTPSEGPVIGARPGEVLCRPTPNGRDVTGCYLTLASAVDDRLVAVSSPEAARGEIHEMKTEDGVMRMRELTDGLPLPAGETVHLRPGGDHLMLFGLTRPLVAGDTISLTLTFEKAPPLGVRAQVAQPTAAGH